MNTYCTTMRDWLFKLRLYRGTQIRCPYGLVTCRAVYPRTLLTKTYVSEFNPAHCGTDWLFTECEGPWRVRILQPMYYRRFAIAFARPADALTFRIIVADNAD
jgi:hypothetical protein